MNGIVELAFLWPISTDFPRANSASFVRIILTTRSAWWWVSLSAHDTLYYTDCHLLACFRLLLRPLDLGLCIALAVLVHGITVTSIVRFIVAPTATRLRVRVVLLGHI